MAAAGRPQTIERTTRLRMAESLSGKKKLNSLEHIAGISRGHKSHEPLGLERRPGSNI
jgi:hypothetical protein